MIVPKGFQDALLAGIRAELQFAPNPLQTFSPAIAAAVLDVTALIGTASTDKPPRRCSGSTRRASAGRPMTADDAAEIARGFFEAARRLSGLTAVGI